jgi:hypothetical protein
MNGVTQWEAKEIIREKNATIEAQAAEIERLRGKLQYMADTNLADDDYRIIAREALAGKAEQ